MSAVAAVAVLGMRTTVLMVHVYLLSPSAVEDVEQLETGLHPCDCEEYDLVPGPRTLSTITLRSTTLVRRVGSTSDPVLIPSNSLPSLTLTPTFWRVSVSVRRERY